MILSTREEFKSSLGFSIGIAGEVLTHPTKTALIGIAKVIKPSKLKTSCEVISQIAFRIMVAAVVIFSLPYHLTLGLIGFTLHAIATPLRKKITIIQGPDEKFSGYQIKVCTFNTALLPDCVNLIKPDDMGSHIAPIPGTLEERVNNIVAAIELVEADVVCLQEVLDPRAARLLRQRLSKTYPHMAYNANPQIVRFNSGLMTLSKTAIDSVAFEEYTDSIGIDSLAGKGYLSVKLQHTAGKVFSVFNTHLNSDVTITGGFNGYEAEPIRENQIEHLFKDAAPDRDIVCGDLNTLISERKGFEITRAVIDYIFFPRDSHINSHVNKMNNSSDHPAVVATIKLNKHF